MAKKSTFTDSIDTEIKAKKDSFVTSLGSEMYYESDLNGGSMSFEWLDQIEFAAPFIDNVIRIPKLSLVKQEIIVPAERTKKVTVESIKDLSKHPNYVDEMDLNTGDVRPNRILNVISEETYNIYENRFLYTLIHDMETFIRKKEDELKNLKLSTHKFLEYSGSTKTDIENINIELRITSDTFPSDVADKKLKDEIRRVKVRLKRINDYVSSWHRSAMFKELDKAHVHYLNPPIKKTNIFLKNPNFKVAQNLYDYLLKQNGGDDDNSTANLEKNSDPFQGFLDHAFLIDFCVLDSVSRRKRDQKEKMSYYAILLLKEEIHRTLDMLMSAGIDISDDELIKMIAEELKKDRNNRLVGVEDVKKKFKSAIDEYMERMQDYL